MSVLNEYPGKGGIQLTVDNAACSAVVPLEWATESNASKTSRSGNISAFQYSDKFFVVFVIFSQNTRDIPSISLNTFSCDLTSDLKRNRFTKLQRVFFALILET